MTPSLTIERRSISLAAAQRMIAAAVAKATELSIPMAVTVTDDAGEPVAFVRMDGAPFMCRKIADDKAYTAASFGMPTDAWHEAIRDDPPLTVAFLHTDRLVAFGGGEPVQHDGLRIGAVGVSGGHYDQDILVAQAARDALIEASSE